MAQEERLGDHVKFARKQKADRSVRLGDVLDKLMNSHISPRHEQFGPVAELWEQLLPTELAEHCKIAGLSGGELKVAVDSPAHLYELRLCSSELLGELQRCCPRSRIRGIKFVIE